MAGEQETAHPTSVRGPTNGWEYAAFFTHQLFRFLSRALWPVTVAFACLCFYWSVVALAGEDTDAEIIWKLFADVGIDKILSYSVAGGGIGYGLYERRVRKNSLRDVREQAEKYERLADPNRGSSGLKPGGDMPDES